jgi:localization factor PodJL
MTSGAWSTRPFRPETLEAAREAARRSGLSLAQWLNSAILDTAADAGVRAGRRGFDADDLGPHDDALATIGERLDQLARRIDQLIRRDDEPGAWHQHTPATQSAPEMRNALHTIEARLASMVRELVPQGQAASQRLVEVIRDLNARLDRLATIAPERADVPAHDPPAGPAPREPTEDRAKRGDRVASLSSALAEISARQRELDAEIGAQDFSRLERQLRHITEQIETLRHPGDAAEAAAARDADRAALERVETQILELARKLDRSDARLEALDTIERRIVELAHKLETSDARLDGVEALERSLADLMFQLKEVRAAAVEEAQRAAKNVAGEMLADSDATGNEIDALKQDLTELRVSRAEIDHRTEDALETLQRTLERLVDRLATIETGIRTAARNSPEPQEARGPSTRSQILSATTPGPKLAPEQRPFDPDLPADHPLEPGSGVPRGRGPASAAPRSAASEPAQANPAAPEPAAKANFIAAARRAAQAAAAESAEPTEPAEERSQGGGIAAAMGRRRSIMIAAGVLLFGAGGLLVAINGDVPPMPGIEDLARIAAKISAAEDIRTPIGKARSARASVEARTARVPEPIVPESGSSPARRPSGAAGEDFLLSPVPSGSLTPTPNPQARESVAPATAWPSPPPARTSEITGSLPVAQANPATLASQRPTPEPAPDAAEKLPPAIGSSALRAAAGAGNPAAEYEIGIRFSEGRGVPQSFEEAALWLARAADHGLAPAQYRLGSLYEKGQGVKKDLTEARRLYLAAAQQGNGKAMHNLAVLYAVGIDGGPDYKTASQWFQKAADHGIADSQYNLGILYARGVGVEQNLAEAFKWFALAAQQGDKDAAKKRDEVAGRLDPQALIAARLAVQTWTADPQPDKAIKVEAPGGDWDRALPVTPASKSKAGRRTGTSGSA